MDEYEEDVQKFDKLMDELAKSDPAELKIPICPNCKSVPSRNINYITADVRYACSCGYPGQPVFIAKSELNDPQKLKIKLDSIKTGYLLENQKDIKK